MKRFLLFLALVFGLGACTSPSPAPGLSPSPRGPGNGAVPGEPPSGHGHLGSRPPAPSSPPAAGWWHPKAGMSWQWQLTGTIDTSVNVEVYDVDAFTTPAATVSALEAAGRHTICYVNAGAKEDFRPDAGKFPTSVVGKALEGWPGERSFGATIAARAASCAVLMTCCRASSGSDDSLLRHRQKPVRSRCCPRSARPAPFRA